MCRFSILFTSFISSSNVIPTEMLIAHKSTTMRPANKMFKYKIIQESVFIVRIKKNSFLFVLYL